MTNIMDGEIREDYDHLAAAKQLLGVYYATDDHSGASAPLLEVLNEAVIALADAINGKPQLVKYRDKQ